MFHESCQAVAVGVGERTCGSADAVGSAGSAAELGAGAPTGGKIVIRIRSGIVEDEAVAVAVCVHRPWLLVIIGEALDDIRIGGEQGYGIAAVREVSGIRAGEFQRGV